MSLQLNTNPFWTPSRLRMLFVCTLLVAMALWTVQQYRELTRTEPLRHRPQPAESENFTSPEKIPDWLKIVPVDTPLDAADVRHDQVESGAASTPDKSETEPGERQRLALQSITRRATRLDEPPEINASATAPKRSFPQDANTLPLLFPLQDP